MTPTDLPAAAFVLCPLLLLMYTVLGIALVRSWQAERFNWRETAEAQAVLEEAHRR